MNLPAITYATQGALPSLPPELMANMIATMGNMFDGLGGTAIRRIKTRKTDFLLIDGSEQVSVPGHELLTVIVGANPVNHAVWYEKQYAPGQEPEAPDLTWIMHTMDTFPDALPVQFRSKVMVNGAERWAFQILRRIAVCVMRRDATGGMSLDLAHPYIMDVSSMSLFGKSNPDMNSYKFSGLSDVCRQCSVGGYQVLPSMFITQIMPDPNVSVSSVVCFRPERDATGSVRFLDAGLIGQIHEVAARQTTRDMLQIREKLTYGNAAPSPAPMQTPVQAPVMTFPPLAQPTAAPVQAPAQMPAGFTMPSAMPPQNTVLTMPVQVPTTALTNTGGAPDMQSLLMQAQAALAAVGQPQPQAPVQNLFLPPIVQPQPQTNPQGPSVPAAPAAGAVDPSVQNSVETLLAALN